MKLLFLFIILFIIANSAFAQITGSGNIGYLPKFSGTTVVTSSLIYDNGTKVGIGTTVTCVTLKIDSRVILDLNTSNFAIFCFDYALPLCTQEWFITLK